MRLVATSLCWYRPHRNFGPSSRQLACNAIFTHIFGSIRTHVYSPGIVTGTILPVVLVN
nr:HXXEE domain-containing protein [Lactiplantibacillus plantarum]